MVNSPRQSHNRYQLSLQHKEKVSIAVVKLKYHFSIDFKLIYSADIDDVSLLTFERAKRSMSDKFIVKRNNFWYSLTPRRRYPFFYGNKGLGTFRSEGISIL